MSIKNEVIQTQLSTHLFKDETAYSFSGIQGYELSVLAVFFRQLAGGLNCAA